MKRLKVIVGLLAFFVCATCFGIDCPPGQTEWSFEAWTDPGTTNLHMQETYGYNCGVGGGADCLWCHSALLYVNTSRGERMIWSSGNSSWSLPCATTARATQFNTLLYGVGASSYTYYASVSETGCDDPNMVLLRKSWSFIVVGP